MVVIVFSWEASRETGIAVGEPELPPENRDATGSNPNKQSNKNICKVIGVIPLSHITGPIIRMIASLPELIASTRGWISLYVDVIG